MSGKRTAMRTEPHREEEQYEEHDAAGDAARCGMGL